MQRELIITEDGSHTFYIPQLDEQYHSVHGAIQESEHIFIHSGLAKCQKEVITVFEVGFGTGLNALLSMVYANSKSITLNYLAIEKYPISIEEATKLNYPEIVVPSCKSLFIAMHEAKWDNATQIQSNFSLTKIKGDLRETDLSSLPLFDVVYFDAFAPNKQPDLWSESVYNKIYNNCSTGALLVTYCAKGVVRRELATQGFNVERIAGPPGKKEMLRAIK
ncbi:MAG: tRNA (5-methylaminomethyl-2-thiouridine)(34)-methyltransferase MnmD [Bacteroidales bacterium]|nr:tRNA (5-methylaminomethyl-2-thiouridine)(34)-methyltransferase MnmD [Bacteroidales bacterium]